MDNNFNNSYQQSQPQQTQYQYQQGAYQPVGQYYPGPGTPQPQLEEPVSTGDWVGSMLLIGYVPIVGLVFCIIWAFSKKIKKSKSNFCKAYLIVTLIGLGISLVISLIFIGIMLSLVPAMEYYYYY